MKVASVCYATEQGLGRLAKDFYDAGVITHPIINLHTDNPNHLDWYPPSTPTFKHGIGRSEIDRVIDYLKQIQPDVLLAWETFFEWDLVTICRKLGIKTALVVMYEWSPKQWPAKPDKLICPSLLDQQYFPGSPFLPIPIKVPCKHCNGVGAYSFPEASSCDGSDGWYECQYCDKRPFNGIRWQQRATAKKFLHNAGHVGHREHKGTRQLLEAIPLIRSLDLRLIIRCQEEKAWGDLIGTFSHQFLQRLYQDERVKIEVGGVPYESLFDGFDVYVAPERFNGLSLPLQEAYAAGMVVMTSDRFPHNTWLPKEPIIPVHHYEKACISRNYLEFDEAIVTPQAIAAKIDEWVGRDITDYSLSGRTWAEANSWEALKTKWLEELAR